VEGCVVVRNSNCGGLEMKPKKMNPEVFPNNTGIRKLYNDLKLEVEALREENKYLRNRTTKLLEK